MNQDDKQVKPEHSASASLKDVSISTKHSIEISHALRYKNTNYAKNYLGEVIVLKRAVPFRRFLRNVGHKKGMSAGRYPQKAAKEFLRLLKSVEANAHAKGLDTSNLKITKLVANQASIPFVGGRSRRGTKRTHLAVEVRESLEKGKSQEKSKERKKTKTAKTKGETS